MQSVRGWLPPFAVGALRDHLARQMREIGDGYEDEGLVFASQTGKTMSASNVAIATSGRF